MRANLKHGTGTRTTRLRSTKPGIEKTRIMDSKLPDERIEGRHFGRMVRRNPDRFFRSKDVELARIKDEMATVAPVHRFPEIQQIMRRNPVNVDEAGVALGPVSNEP